MKFIIVGTILIAVAWIGRAVEIMTTPKGDKQVRKNRN